MIAAKNLEIEALNFILLIVLHAGVLIMTLNGKSRVKKRNTMSIKRICGLVPAVTAMISAAAFSSAAEAPQKADERPESKQAQTILEATGVQGGLIVHVGCGEGGLTIALRANDRYVVHGLDADAACVAKDRERAISLGVEGPVSFDVFTGGRLPLIDNTANLVVCENLGGVSMSDVERVLVPGGVVYAKSGDKWAKTVKPRPKEIDEWTHFLHGPDGNAVARDSVVDSPFHMQWVGSPRHSKTHGHLSSVNVIVSSGGRLFYIVDEGLRALPESLPSEWALYARDAFNGVVLWRRPLERWQVSKLDSRNRFPADLHRRLVADGDTVYATMSIFGPVSAVNGATGETIRTYDRTENAEEIIFDKGVLYLVVNNEGADKIDRRQIAQWRTDVLPKRVMAIRASDGKVLWEKRDNDAASLMPLTLASGNGQIFFQNTENVIALDAQTGKEKWRTANQVEYVRPTWSAPTLVAKDGVVLVADRGKTKADPSESKTKAGTPEKAKLTAFSAETGKVLWTLPCAEGAESPADIFVSDGLVWVGELMGRKEQDYRNARNLLTGEVAREYPESPDWPEQHHHRCYRDKATEKYILAGRTGIESIDMATGALTTHNWLRGNCQNGILPCNGLIYMPPEQCGCYVESKLTGFHALAPKRSAEKEKEMTVEDQASRLEKGPAFGEIEKAKSEEMNSNDWPTYRKDAARSGHTAAIGPTKLGSVWEANLGGRLTPPVAAYGKLFVASIDTHALHCLEADGGKALWTYVAGGRIDSPPTIANGLAVFGCHDGWVYALRASDGRLVWRYRAAPQDLKLVAEDQVESVWPVSGSVLIQGGAIYCAAGRSSYLDGGVTMYKLNLTRGEPMVEKQFFSRDPKTGKTVFLYNPYKSTPGFDNREMPGLIPDVLSSDGDNIWMRNATFGPDLKLRENKLPHLFTWTGFLDDSWWERTYWIYGDHFYAGMSGVQYARGIVPSGRIMVFDSENVYGYKDETFTKNRGAEGLFAISKKPSFASPPKNERKTEREKTSKRAKRAEQQVLAHDWLSKAPLYPNGMVLAGEVIFLAGSPKFDELKTRDYLDEAKTDDRPPVPLLKDAIDTFEGRKGALLLAVNKKDGKRIAECALSSPPVFDGMIAANGRLYASTKAGTVVCVGEKP